MASKQSMNLVEMGKSQNRGSDAVWEKIFYTLADLNNSEQREQIDLRNLRKYLSSEKSLTLELKTGLPRYRLVYLVNQLKQYADANRDGKVTRKEWQDWVKQNENDFMSKSKAAGGIMRVIAYSPTYSCSPPTIFLGVITLLQITFYLLSLYAPYVLDIKYDYGDKHWLLCSFFIYNPHRRREVWRFITYMFLHGNHQHIIFNCLMQLFVGIPLEMSQPGWLGSLRVTALYMAGVIFGSLAASVVQPTNYLIGASAGVYALIAAHLATLILNWKEDGEVYQRRMLKATMSDEAQPPLSLNPLIRGLRLLFVILFTCFDIGQIIYVHVVLGQPSSTSYVGHAFGAMAGLLIGVFVLINRKVEDWEVIFKWIAFTIFGLLLCLLVAWHIIGTATGWFPVEVWETQQICLI